MSVTYEKLISNLEEQVRVYRHLLDVVRNEKEILISANLDDLTENNKTKESMLIKVRGLEVARIRYTVELSEQEGLKIHPNQLRLLDLAIFYGGQKEERIRSLHSVLDLLLKRVQEYNKQNEVLVESALEKITGAMKAIRDTLKDKPVYKNKGQVKDSSAPSGKLVSREA